MATYEVIAHDRGRSGRLGVGDVLVYFGWSYEDAEACRQVAW